MKFSYLIYRTPLKLKINIIFRPAKSDAPPRFRWQGRIVVCTVRKSSKQAPRLRKMRVCEISYMTD